MTTPHFRTLVAPAPPPLGLPISSPHLLLGSCFASELGQRLEAVGLPAMTNPFGPLYHPLPILYHLQRLLHPKPYDSADLVERDGQWFSLHHHGSVSASSKDGLLHLLDDLQADAAAHLTQCGLLALTVGTSWGYYHRERGLWVANCHRLPADSFERRICRSDELLAAAEPILRDLCDALPDLAILLTVSPVRHLRDSAPENSLSKAQLVTLVHDLCDRLPRCRYFPAYELLLDDLRDYRFYAHDLAHPNGLAVDYIWSHFVEWVFEPEARVYLELATDLRRRLGHRPRNPQSPTHQAFQQQTANHIAAFLARYPFASRPHPLATTHDATA